MKTRIGIPALALAAVLVMGMQGRTPALAEIPAQTEAPLPRSLVRPLPGRQVGPPALMDLRRRLLDLDTLLSLGSVSRAQVLLDELSQHSQLAQELQGRRIRLAQLQGEHEKAILLCREALRDKPRSAGLWRALAASELAAGRPDSARHALDRFLVLSTNVRGAGVVAAEQLIGGGQCRHAVALIDSLRTVLADSTFLARQKAACLLAAGSQKQAAREVSVELRANPLNLSLLRMTLLDSLYDPVRNEAFCQALAGLARGADGRPAERVLAADLMLAGGMADEAWSLIEPLVGGESSALLVMQNVATLSSELELLPRDRQHQATVDFLLRVLARLIEPGTGDALLQRRAADQLAQVCAYALTAEALGEDPRQAVERFGALLQQVRRINPNSEHLYSSQIKLAEYTRKVLGDPGAAARRLEHMLLDLDLPTEGVALARLSLGECYLAAGDTARGRAVLTQLGRDPQLRQAGGFAHFHLARLDLAEGHFATARDRFAVVAMENPAAPYANDALELGLAVAEELDNPTGGPDILALYAQVVQYALVDRPAERLAALETFVREAALRVDLEEPQHLLERGRFELAQEYRAQGDLQAALAQLEILCRDHPDGRHPAQSLFLQGRWLMEAGRVTEAQQAWSQLLAQYPDFLFIDDVRDELRNLP